MASPFEAEVLDILKAAYESDKPQALAIIQAGEGGVVKFITDAIGNAHLSGIAGLLLHAVAGSLEAAVNSYVAAHGPEVVYDFIDRLLAEEAAKLAA